MNYNQECSIIIKEKNFNTRETMQNMFAEFKRHLTEK